MEDARQVGAVGNHAAIGGLGELVVGEAVDFLPGVFVGHLGEPGGEVGEPIGEDVEAAGGGDGAAHGAAIELST